MLREFFSFSPENKDAQNAKFRDTSLEMSETGNKTHEEWEEIAEFKELTEGQKELALKNFEQFTLSEVQKQAIEEYQKEREEAGFVKKIGMGVFKRFYVAKNEKETAQETAEKSTDENKEIISEISKNIKEGGLDGYWENGKFLIDYAGGPENFKNLSEEEGEQLVNFNIAAQKMVEAKSEWIYGTGDKKFEKIKEDFEKARADLLNLERGQTGSEFSAATAVAEIDRKVYMNQWLNASPEAGKELEKIQSKWVWTRAFRNTVAEKGGFTAMGYAGRTLAVGALGVLAAPLTAMAIGGWNARKRTIESIKEEMAVAIGGGERKSVELLNIVDAENLAKKIEKISERLENAPPGEERERLIQLMNARLFYTHEKLDRNLVNFGAGKEKITNQYNLIEKLTKAEVLYQSRDEKAETELEKRLEQFLGHKNGKVDKYIAKQMVKGMVMGAGFALLGAALRDMVVGKNPLQETKDYFTNLFSGKNGSGKMGNEIRNMVSADATGVKNLPIASSEKSKEIIHMLGMDKYASNEIGIRTIIETKTEAGAKGIQTMAEKIQEHVATIKKGGSLWAAARELVKQKAITEKQFNEAWGNKHSTFFTSNNVDTHISKMDLVHEGDSLKFIAGTKGEPPHFELVEKTPGVSGTTNDLYENYLRRNIKPPEWLRKDILGKQYIDPRIREMIDNPKEIKMTPINEVIDKLMEKPIPKSPQDWREISPLFKHEHHIPEVETEPKLTPFESSPAPKIPEGKMIPFDKSSGPRSVGPVEPMKPFADHPIEPMKPFIEHPVEKMQPFTRDSTEQMQPFKSMPSIEYVSPKEIKINIENMKGAVEFVYDKDMNPIKMNSNLIVSDADGSKIFKSGWFGEILKMKSAGKKYDIGFLQNELAQDGRNLTMYLKIYGEFSKNPAYEKQTSFVAKSIKFMLKNIPKEFRNLIDPGKIPPIFRKDLE